MQAQVGIWSDIQHIPVDSPTPQPTGTRPPVTRPSWRHRLSFLKRASSAPGISARDTALEDSFASLTRIAMEIAAEGRYAFSVSMQLARHVKTTADRLRNQSKTIDHLGCLATQTGQAAEASCGRIAEAQTLIGVCVEIAHSRTDLIQDLLKNVRQSETSFAALNIRVDDVESFVATIRQIGSQTSLLALNAAIEASRAGGHGAGFNVVAREMRLLADRTEAATKEILSITEGMRQSSAATSASMHGVTGWKRNYEELGLRAIDSLQRCHTLLGQADASASDALRGAETQSDVVETFREEWRTLRQGQRQCTFGADTAAERTMQAASLAVGLNEGLAQLVTYLPPGAQNEPVALQEQQRTLQQTAAACSAQTGLAELKRIRPHILQSVEELLATCVSQGPASRRPSIDSASPMLRLCFGANSVSDNLERIDSLSRRTGLFMSLLVLSEDKHPSFYRVATTIRRGDGQRAVGTQLNPGTAAAQKLLKGESSYGYVYILGLPYLSGYTPIFDAAGQVIGAAFAATCVNSAFDTSTPGEHANAEEGD